MFDVKKFAITRRLTQVAISLGLCAVLSACGTFAGVDSVTKEAGKKNDPADPIVVLAPRKATIDAETDATKQQQLRNDLQNQIIRLSDKVCDDYLRGITQWDTGRKLFFNSISIVAGAAAPLFSSGATESLAVASGLATAANAEISSTVFQQLAFSLVESAIKKSRADRLNDFIELQKKTFGDYGVEAALRDVGDYHQRCALRRGLEILTAKNQSTAPSKVVLETELENVRQIIATSRVALSGTPAVAAVPAVPAVPAIPGRLAVPAVPASPAIPAVPGTPAVPAVPGPPAIPAIPAVPGTPAIPAVPATLAVPAVPGTAAVPGKPAKLGKAAVPPLTGVAANAVTNDLRRAIIEESRIRALLPYAR